MTRRAPKAAAGKHRVKRRKHLLFQIGVIAAGTARIVALHKLNRPCPSKIVLDGQEILGIRNLAGFP